MSKKYKMTETVAWALFRCGHMAGIASTLPVKELQEYLENPPEDFRYANHVEAAVAFAKLVQHRDEYAPKQAERK